MWSKSYSKTVEGLKASEVWKVWTDVNQWHTWQDDIEFARLEGAFTAGNTFQFKPKGGPNVKIEITDVKPDVAFVDLTRFPLARMYDTHELVEHGDKLEIKSTITIEGALSFLWKKLVAENVANDLADQTEKLIEKARQARSLPV